MLNVIAHGEATGAPPLVIAHGLFGSARNWGAIARGLSDLRQVLAVDMRNHGQSFHDDRHDYPAMAGDLAGVIDANGGRAAVLGHSMGGKAAMMLALTRPDTVERLIVADMAPVAYAHDQMEPLRAMRAVDLSAVTTRRDADRQLAAHLSDPGLRAFLLHSLDVAGRQWRLNLPALEANMPAILGWPAVEGRYDGPALFLSGAESAYVRAENRATITDLFPAARFARIPRAGHWLHADRPEAVTEALRTALTADA